MIVPDEMKAEKRWVLHTNKVPKQVDRSPASSTDPKTWTTFDEAYAALKDNPKAFSGLGFVLGDGWGGVDLDNCLDDFREYLWGKDIVDSFDSFAERSPGRYGVKIFFKTEEPLAGGKRWEVGPNKERVEVYTDGRFFTVTGECLTAPVIRTTTEHLELVRRYGDLPQQSVKVDPLACVEGCRQQLKTLPDSIEGDGGHNALFRAACEIWRWGVTDEDALTLLHEYNERSVPPWEDSEIARKLEQTRPVVIGEGTFGVRVAIPFGEVLEASNNRFPAIRKADELVDADLHVEYLIEGLLVEGQHALLFGAEKTLKTSIALDLGISVASGSPFLGRGRILKPGPVLMLSAESGLPTLRENALEIARTKGIDLRAQEWYVADETIQLTDVAAVKWAGQVIDDKKIKLLIIDPLYLSMGTASGDVSNMMLTGQALQGIAAVAARKGCTVVFLHHTSKGAQRAKRDSPIPTITDAAQAGFASHTRQWLAIGRKADFDPNAKEHIHKLAIGFGGSAGHAEEWTVDVNVGKPTDPDIGRKWEVDARPYDPNVDFDKEVTARMDMIKADVLRETQITISAIEKRYGRQRVTTEALKRLELDPQVAVTDVTAKNGKDVRGVRVKNNLD